jgi:ankyrin repeat protein
MNRCKRQPSMDDMDTSDPLAEAVVEAIHKGEIEKLKILLLDNPGLATVRLGKRCGGGMSRTLLHVATDWPGNYPNCADSVKVLIDAGADVNARFTGPHTETPLHWAASSDDVEVLDALLDAGADIEADGGVVGNGTPLADAVAFGQWKVARRLIERGASSILWQDSGLGLMDRIKAQFETGPKPPKNDVTGAFWTACHGNQREAAAYLLEQGADPNWVGYDKPDTARSSSSQRSGRSRRMAAQYRCQSCRYMMSKVEADGLLILTKGGLRFY